MSWRILGAATIALSIAIPFNSSGAKASFGRYDGGLYRVEIPEDWNGELVLWAHGFVDNKGAQGSRLCVGFPGGGQEGLLREHLVRNGFAWAASSYRCNGYIPGVGLLDTRALTEVFLKSNGGRAPTRIYMAAPPWAVTALCLACRSFRPTLREVSPCVRPVQAGWIS